MNTLLPSSQRFRRLWLTTKVVVLTFILLSAGTMPAAARKQRPKVGLVLGGGGAKGAAEIGVLRYIEEAGVPIDYIVGTSIGSIVGGLYSCGMRADDLDTLFRSQQWLDLFTGRHTDLEKKTFVQEDGQKFIFGFPVGKHYSRETYGYGLLKGDSICNFLDRLTQRSDSICFDDLPIPFRCVAVEANSFTEKAFDRGHLAECMRASMSIPIVFKPVLKDSLVYVDGGMLNNLPVDVCREMGADIIIAVDLTQEHHSNDHFKALTRAKTQKLLRYPRLMKLLAWNKYRPDLNKYRENLKHIDIYINPDLKGMSAASFKRSKIEKMIRAGEQAGLEALPQLVELSKKLGTYTSHKVQNTKKESKKKRR